MPKRSILVPCERLVWAGGLIRFERVGRVLRGLGHDLVFMPFAPADERARKMEMPLITPEDAAARAWDATMVPGAGFSDAVIARFSTLTAPNFGTRVQHVLNDQTKRTRFTAVNRAFAPHLVIFNNRHWPPGSYMDFRARRFHHLEGAVDLARFAPGVRTEASAPFVIGGLANKNPQPLLEAARQLPDVEVRLFGDPGALGKSAADLIEAGRLRLVGTLSEDQLPAFYRGLDCVVHTELFAGWANLAAEALAAGVPLICTPHGTLAFAQDEFSALVLPEPTAEAIVSAVMRLRGDEALRARLSRVGRDAIASFSWERYTSDLLALIAFSDESPDADGGQHPHKEF